MLESALQKKAEEATAIYGSEFIKNDLPSGFPNISAWSPHLKAQPDTEFEFWKTPAENQGDREVPIKDWLENEDPFTQLDLVEIEDKMVQQFIFYIRRSTSIPNNERLANRLSVLFNDAKEEDDNSPGIAIGSLRNFYHFLQEYTNQYTNLKYPDITLTPDNDIYASWRGEKNRVFNINFLSSEDVRFIIFKPNDKHPERRIIHSVTATIDTLLEEIASSGILDWISG